MLQRTLREAEDRFHADLEQERIKARRRTQLSNAGSLTSVDSNRSLGSRPAFRPAGSSGAGNAQGNMGAGSDLANWLTEDPQSLKRPELLQVVAYLSEENQWLQECQASARASR